MFDTPESVPARTVLELSRISRKPYANPFADVRLEGDFISPSGERFVVPGFYDGDVLWRVRFSPDEPGAWRYRLRSHPADAELDADGAFEVGPRAGRGFLRATPGEAWGFRWESGEPAFLLGDTVYNLFGMAYCGIDVAPFLERRARQGFNLLRVRLPVSHFHPPDGYNQWQTHRTWPWGGSEQAPLFDRFNLPYFHVVDRVVGECERLGLGLELIMEGWGFEFPFNSRQIFTPEWEEVWMRWLVARYDAYSCVAMWTPLNEYEYYPNGDWHHEPVADRWAMRVGRWLKDTAPHGHIVAIHNGPTAPPFAERFAADPEAIDVVMLQSWGTTGRDDAWLAAGIEDTIRTSLSGWGGSAVLAEYGYERNPALELKLPNHRYCGPQHTRRGAWRGAMSGLGVVHGWENSWGPWALLAEDQPGLRRLLHLREFFTRHVPWERLRPAPDALANPAGGVQEPGTRPLALATPERDVVVAYTPVGDPVLLPRAGEEEPAARWYDPRTGMFLPAERFAGRADVLLYTTPRDVRFSPDDWVLLVERGEESVDA